MIGENKKNKDLIRYWILDLIRLDIGLDANCYSYRYGYRYGFV